MSFSKLQQRLREEGWFVEWKMPCCQTCAWAEIPSTHQVGPFEGQEIDLSKVLFNHDQDCLSEEEECIHCHGDGYIMECHDSDGEDTEEQCMNCDGMGFHESHYENASEAPGSLFCFDGSKEGTKNLVDILPLIEESGCDWGWDKSGGTRIEISW